MSIINNHEISTLSLAFTMHSRDFSFFSPSLQSRAGLKNISPTDGLLLTICESAAFSGYSIDRISSYLNAQILYCLPTSQSSALYIKHA